MPVVPPGIVFDRNDVEILFLYLPMLIANGGNVVAALAFSHREKIARKNSNRKRPRRDVQGSKRGGFWKSTTVDKSVVDDHGQVLEFLKVLNFYEYHAMDDDDSGLVQEIEDLASSPDED
ncbi:hypothetical protein V6N13_014213 [Hibiscus sabdariffa]|uniref:NAC domain-containing protein n=1 Tax=Hibiscus sabdariffa TaxID=183260 RepID=A0ABR2RUL2_9ROSI